MLGKEQSVAEEVVDAVAAANDADPLALPPLYDAVDPDALTALIREMNHGKVCFRYAGRSVTVRSDSAVAVDDDHLPGSPPSSR